MKKRLAIVGIVFLFVIFFLFAIGLVSQNARASGAAGTWTGTCTDQTGAADYHYDVVLTLNGGSSISGTMTLTCTGVDVKISGFGDTKSIIGTVQTCSVQGTLSGSSLTIHATDQYGCTYIFYMTVSGSTMTGNGHYTGSSGETDNWSFNLNGGSGNFGSTDGTSGSSGSGGSASFNMAALAIPAASIAFAGGVLGSAASFSPHIIRGAAVHKNQGPFYAGHKPVRQRPDPHRPFNVRPQQRPPPAQAPQQQTQQPQPPPLADPRQSLTMPIIQRGSTIGNHPVPCDAPMQCPPNRNPDGYPYGRGTSANMRCPYCGLNTLSPFTAGWFCTNPQCPARRDLLQKGYTTHDYNNMTWRRL